MSFPRTWVHHRFEGGKEVDVLFMSRGLAVTADADGQEGWAVTHLNSGAALALGPYREDTARKLCLALAGLHDWANLPFAEVWRLQKEKKTAGPIKAAIRQAQAEDAS